MLLEKTQDIIPGGGTPGGESKQVNPKEGDSDAGGAKHHERDPYAKERTLLGQTYPWVRWSNSGIGGAE